MILACAVCFGQSDSPLAQGTNMAIFFMLGVTAVMLAAFASFFIYLIRRKRLFADDVDSVPAHERTV
jgi:Na+-transporting NADH:ubiquinone oxidoreductase subunit NqrD